MELLDSTPETYNPALKRKLLIDICVQSLLFCLTMAWWLMIFTAGENDYDVPAGIFYLGLGSYQLISSLVHLTYKQRNVLYRAYYTQLFIHLFIFLSAFLGGGLVSMLGLLFLTPLTAIYYFVITVVTYNQMR